MSGLINNSQKIRNTLLSRNLYTPDNQYIIDNSRLINTINAIASTINPFKAIDISNTFLGRLLPDTNTPITKIGEIMLGNQFANNVAENLQRKSLPTVNSISEILNGKSVFTKNINNTITVAQTDNNIISNLISSGIDSLIYSNENNNPLKNDSTNIEILKNTGSGQLTTLSSQIFANQYRDSSYITIFNDKNIDTTKAKISSIINNKTWFLSKNNDSTFNFIKNNRYPNSNISDNNLRNNYLSYVLTGSNNDLFYGSTLNYLDSLGKSNKYGETSLNNISNNQHIKSYGDGFEDNPYDIYNKIIWGRDGVSSNANNKLKNLRSNTSSENNITTNNDVTGRFNASIGLLEYTSELLNASNGSFVDQTRKVFKDLQGNIVGFNGSGVWQAPNNALEHAGEIGVRQHTALDQYNRFAKAIRFGGNILYNGGNSNSVTYKSVFPKITPNLAGDNKNLMFSIENLAVEVIKDEENQVGYLTDDYNTIIPITEVGDHNCRLMWFPPYSVELNEQSNAKWQSTEFIGRSEPVYTYNGSERSANLSFKLLIDYPEQLIQYRGDSEFHRKAAEFFAFGGTFTSKTAKSKQLVKSIQDLTVQKENIDGIKKLNPLPNIPIKPLTISFPNNMPDGNQVDSIFNLMFNNINYEILSTLNSNDQTSFGINNDFYYIPDGIINYGLNGLPYKYTTSDTNANNYIDQYSYDDTFGGLSKIDKVIMDILNPQNYDDGNVPITINLTGRASKLYDESQYNIDLSARRILAVQHLIEQRFLKMFGKTIYSVGVKFKTNAIGFSKSDPSNGTIDKISEQATKLERTVEITFTQNPITNYKTDKLSTQDQQDSSELGLEITSANQQLKSLSLGIDDVSRFKQLGELDSSEGPQLGFKSINKNVFYPVFHSQTPEDFHRRLTFLQQCIRQGNAVRKTNSDKSSLSSSNSVFGRPPFCVLRYGDFLHTKFIIEQLVINYEDAPWDVNSENFGTQPMICSITLQTKLIGGESLRGPIDALQNALSFNYYANSTFRKTETYSTPALIEAYQFGDTDGIATLESEKKKRNNRASFLNDKKVDSTTADSQKKNATPKSKK